MLEKLIDWFKNLRNRLRTLWKLRQTPELLSPSAAAMRKVYKALPKLPPDTLSGGVQNGGEALFFRHDDGIEVFIGKNYDHAADKFIEWYREEEAAEVAPTTKTTTKMPRRERRAASSALRQKRTSKNHRAKAERPKKRGHKHRSR